MSTGYYMNYSQRPPVGLLFALLVVIILLLLYGCKSPPVIERSDTVRINTVVRHDSTVYLTDSAGLYALLYCDSARQVHIRQIEQFYAGQFIKPKVVIKDNYLEVDCKIDSAAVSFAWNEHTSTTSTNTVTVKEVNYVSGWQWFQIWLCRVLIVAGALVGIFYAIKNSAWWLVLISWATKISLRLFKKKL